MVGKLQKSSERGRVYLLVAVDKFTKWIEAKPVTNQGAADAIKFFESIVYRFGVPHSIITDNGSNFTSGEFSRFYDKFGINVSYALVAHTQTNGQVKKSNMSALVSRSDYCAPLNEPPVHGPKNYHRSYGA